MDLPKGAEHSAAYSLHKSLGLLVPVLTVCCGDWVWQLPCTAASVSQWLASAELPVACMTRSILHSAADAAGRCHLCLLTPHLLCAFRAGSRRAGLVG